MYIVKEMHMLHMLMLAGCLFSEIIAVLLSLALLVTEIVCIIESRD